MESSPQLTFRTSKEEQRRRGDWFNEMLLLSQSELEEIAGTKNSVESYRAIFILGWQAAWRGDLDKASQALDSIRDATIPADRDVVDMTRAFWIAITNRKVIKVWRHLRRLEKLENIGEKMSLLERSMLLIDILKERWPYITYYVPLVLLGILVVASVIAGGWLFVLVLVSLLVGLVLTLAIGFSSHDGPSSLP